MDTKTCNACGIEKPTSAFYPHKKYGFRGICKQCDEEKRQAKLRAADPSYQPRKQWSETGLKVCVRCKAEKPISDFGVRPERGGAPRSMCKPCSNAARDATRDSAYNSATAKTWREKNPDKRRAYKRLYYHRNLLEQRAIARKKSAEWRVNNKELANARTLASQNKRAEYYKKQKRDWDKANPAYCRAKYKAYMTQKMQAMPAWADKNKIMEFYEEAQLLSSQTGVVHHVDHIVPLQSKIVCGLHNEFNLQVLPGPENVSKGNRRWPDMP